MIDLNEIKSLISELNIHTIEIGFSDIHGVLRGKRISARHFINSVNEGFALSKGILAWDINCLVFPGIDFANFENGYRDMVAKPILSTFRVIPWRQGSALVLCDLYDTHDNFIEVAPRAVLNRQIKKANDLDYRPMIGAELEFYLLNNDRQPLYQGIQCYSLYKGSELEFILEEIRVSLEKIDIYVEASNPEYGPAQVEINLGYNDALVMADNTLIFKNAVKEIARKHGLYATFMPKPWSEESGNGFHIHQSLYDSQKQVNIFEKNEVTALNYLAGLLLTAREFMALGSPSINSFKRLQDHSFAPINVTWGHDNRTVATRSLLGHGKASRLEYRTGSADANPYLLIAANLASGIYGIENQLVPPPITANNAYVNDAPLLPTNLKDALNLLESSNLAKESLGASFIELFITMGRHEISLYEKAVTDWERKRYLEMA